MKRLLFVATIAVVALSYTTGLQAQTGGQTSNSSTKIAKKQSGASKLPRCTRARQMSGAPCSGG